MESDDADETGPMDEGYGGQTVDSNVDWEDIFAVIVTTRESLEGLLDPDYFLMNKQTSCGPGR